MKTTTDVYIVEVAYKGSKKDFDKIFKFSGYCKSVKQTLQSSKAERSKVKRNKSKKDSYGLATSEFYQFIKQTIIGAGYVFNKNMSKKENEFSLVNYGGGSGAVNIRFYNSDTRVKIYEDDHNKVEACIGYPYEKHELFLTDPKFGEKLVSIVEKQIKHKQKQILIGADNTDVNSIRK